MQHSAFYALSDRELPTMSSMRGVMGLLCLSVRAVQFMQICMGVDMEILSA